jgi:hypothetical protein
MRPTRPRRLRLATNATTSRAATFADVLLDASRASTSCRCPGVCAGTFTCPAIDLRESSALHGGSR